MDIQNIASLNEAITQYEIQLSQVQLAVAASSPGPDRDNLISLKADIEELIQLTKQNLRGLHKQNETSSAQPTTEDPFAKEYALFKAEMEAADAFAETPTKDTSGLMKTEVCDLSNIQADLNALQGMKCQAPHSHHWGDSSYHNALVCGIESSEDITSMDQIQVRVMFTNPTHQEMLPCPYYLDGECRFSDEKCRYSHGELVNLSCLQEFKDPDFSIIRPGLQVLAKYNDKLWHRAVVLTGHGKSCEVKFESTGKKSDIDLHDILPLGNGETTFSPSESSDMDDSGDESEVEPSVNAALVEKSLLSIPPTSALGEWEKYTKGIGSRLMAQMGYITGTGLGKSGEGRIEPVEAVVLPAGKSLDHCMELREQAGGDENLFKVEKRLKRLKKKQDQQREKLYEREKQRTSVFDFINNKLGGKQGNFHQLISPPAVDSAKDSKAAPNGLKSESSRGLNVVGFRVGEEIRRAERDLARLRESLTRQSHGSQTHKQLRSKLADKEGELNQLKASEQSINQERNQRKDCRKLSVF